MMLSQCRALAGSKAMTLVERSSSRPVKQVSNGSKYFMKRDGSFMVEVTVGEGETEDQAVRRYMRAVVQSGVLTKLRNRRYKESRIELAKRRLAEKAQARKLGIEEPTWEEFYGEAVEEAKPFEEFFSKPGDDDEAALIDANLPSLEGMDGGGDYYAGPMYDLNSYNNNVADQGGYLDNNAAPYYQQQQQQGSYAPPAQQQPGSFGQQ